MPLVCAGLWAGGEDARHVSLDPEFRPAFTTTRGAVLFAAALQADQKILIAGDFALVDGLARRSVARLNSRGQVDPEFDAGSGVDGLVYALAIQSRDPKIVVGGAFTVCGGRPFRSLARLLPKGDPDTTFHPRLDGSGDWRVSSLWVQPDGRILVGGSFETADGLPRRGLARLMPSGDLDRSFNPGTGVSGGVVHELSLQPDGRILVAGSFTEIDGHVRQGLARLHPDGRVDETLVCDVQSNGAAGSVFAVTLDARGGIVLGGDFDTAGSVPNVGLARLGADGFVDASFDSQFGTVGDGNLPYDLAATPDGQVIATGSFWYAGGAERMGVVRIGASGSADPGFDPGPGLISRGVAFGNMALVQKDGRVVIVGQFEEAGGVRRHCVTRFLPDGSVDPEFSRTNSFLETQGVVHTVAPLTEGRWLVGGDFERVNGVWRQGLAVLESDGSLRTEFDARLGPDAEVRAVAVQTGGRLLVGGWFDRAGDQDCANFAVLQQGDGSVDPRFAGAGADGPVRTILALPDGRSVVAGEFRQFGDVRRLGAVKVGENGEPDLSFEPRFEIGLDHAAVNAVARDAGDRLLVGGYFDTVNGEPRAALARLMPDGSLDPGFRVEFAGDGTAPTVNAIAVRADGRILVGGSFASIHRQRRPGLARLYPDGGLDASFMPEQGLTSYPFGEAKAFALLADGQLLVAGRWGAEPGQVAPRLALFSNSGLFSASFSPFDELDGDVLTLALQRDGRVMAGGAFSHLLDRPRLGAVRLTVAWRPMDRRLAITRGDAQAEVHWDGEGTLFEALDPAGPWIEIPDARSPKIIPADAGRRFYRWTE